MLCAVLDEKGLLKTLATVLLTLHVRISLWYIGRKVILACTGVVFLNNILIFYIKDDRAKESFIASFRITEYHIIVFAFVTTRIYGYYKCA